ncbi:glutathione S-transferase family protein [Reyranella sp. CPCC 100927]|uniref:glutathione S-transferase family protein n=1 Tax=Reyranella sp. CPCC 100927 TaxID=2599616 RepID=UPI0011B4D5EC|nr:glutathione S-transferase family protein [Reyranella sp. CPCC 100927]TWT14974.1 glutathione S-transferase family protein [Reyranella sp. CPCC 100927]
MYKLYAHTGWGSALTEAQLAWYGLPFETEEVGNLFRSKAARERLTKINPLAQLPTLVLPDGRIMTESVAITFHFADSAPAGRSLVPASPGAERDAFLRWLVFLVTNIYPTFTIGDDTSRWISGDGPRKELQEAMEAYRERLWRMVEPAASDEGPWFLGARFSALDIYISVMTRWTPKRAWFAANAPKLHAIALRGDTVPELAPVWQRNYAPPAAA